MSKPANWELLVGDGGSPNILVVDAPIDAIVSARFVNNSVLIISADGHSSTLDIANLPTDLKSALVGKDVVLWQRDPIKRRISMRGLVS